MNKPTFSALAVTLLAVSPLAQSQGAAQATTTLVGVPTVLAEAIPPATVVPAPKISAQEAKAMVDRISIEVSSIRQLTLLHPVSSGLKTREEIKELYREKMAQQKRSNEMAASELFFKQLGLAPADFDLQKYTIDAKGEQVAGYYDVKKKTFYTSDIVLPSMIERVMAHELTHALQDQHFELHKMRKWPSHESDHVRAITALIESDATLVIEKYLKANPHWLSLQSSYKFSSHAEQQDV
ncbi:MAG: hypothetical protein EOP06_07075 [Proteobacteria bacterium]|nr:MAG: hypothetical protein EOP06_07075 [Pseudomonadota bacterium]